MKTYKIRLNNTEYNKSQEEILEMNLSPDTLVWRKGFVNWMKLKDVPELNPVKTEGSSTKISQLFKGLKPQSKRQEENTLIVTGVEPVEITSKSTTPKSTDGGIILGSPTPKQTKKKMFWVVIIIIVAVVGAILSFNLRGSHFDLFDACDSASVVEDVVEVDSCYADTHVTDSVYYILVE